MAFKEPGGSLPPLHKLAIGPYLQQDLAILLDHNPPVHRCGASGSTRACHAAGPGSIPGRDKFPGWGFFWGGFSSPVRRMSRISFGHYNHPSSFHYGRQWPEMLTRPSTQIYTNIQPTSLKSILISSSYLRLGLPWGLFPSGFPTKSLYAFMNCSIRATCPAHLNRLDLRLLIMLSEEYNACSSALCNFLHSPKYLPKYFILEFILKIFISDGHTDDNFWEKIKYLERSKMLRETKLQENGESYIMLSYMHCILRLT